MWTRLQRDVSRLEERARAQAQQKRSQQGLEEWRGVLLRLCTDRGAVSTPSHRHLGTEYCPTMKVTCLDVQLLQLSDRHCLLRLRHCAHWEGPLQPGAPGWAPRRLGASQRPGWLVHHDDGLDRPLPELAGNPGLHAGG